MKFTLNLSIFVALSTLTLASCNTATQEGSSLNATKKNYCGTDKIKKMTECKNIPGNRRDELGADVKGGNPVAVAVNASKQIFVLYALSGEYIKSCAVGGNVEDFKLSQNPGDVATAYYVDSKDQLWDVRMKGEISKGACPKAAKVNMLEHSKIGGDVQKIDGKYQYQVIPNANSKLVGLALTTNGVLGWSDTEYKRYSKAKSYNDYKSIAGQYK